MNTDRQKSNRTMTYCLNIRLHVTGSDFILLDHTSCYRIICFRPLDRTSCHRKTFFFFIKHIPAIESKLNSCHWIVDHSIRTYKSCPWIELHVIGSERPFDRASGLLIKVCFPECFSRNVTANMAAHLRGQHQTAIRTTYNKRQKNVTS